MLLTCDAGDGCGHSISLSVDGCMIGILDGKELTPGDRTDIQVSYDQSN